MRPEIRGLKSMQDIQSYIDQNVPDDIRIESLNFRFEDISIQAVKERVDDWLTFREILTKLGMSDNDIRIGYLKFFSQADLEVDDRVDRYDNEGDGNKFILPQLAFDTTLKNKIATYERILKMFTKFGINNSSIMVYKNASNSANITSKHRTCYAKLLEPLFDYIAYIDDEDALMWILQDRPIADVIMLVNSFAAMLAHQKANPGQKENRILNSVKRKFYQKPDEAKDGDDNKDKATAEGEGKAKDEVVVEDNGKVEDKTEDTVRDDDNSENEKVALAAWYDGIKERLDLMKCINLIPQTINSADTNPYTIADFADRVNPSMFTPFKNIPSSFYDCEFKLRERDDAKAYLANIIPHSIHRDSKKEEIEAVLDEFICKLQNEFKHIFDVEATIIEDDGDYVVSEDESYYVPGVYTDILHSVNIKIMPAEMFKLSTSRIAITPTNSSIKKESIKTNDFDVCLTAPIAVTENFNEDIAYAIMFWIDLYNYYRLQNKKLNALNCLSKIPENHGVIDDKLEYGIKFGCITDASNKQKGIIALRDNLIMLGVNINDLSKITLKDILYEENGKRKSKYIKHLRKLIGWEHPLAVLRDYTNPLLVDLGIKPLQKFTEVESALTKLFLPLSDKECHVGMISQQSIHRTRATEGLCGINKMPNKADNASAVTYYYFFKKKVIDESNIPTNTDDMFVSNSKKSAVLEEQGFPKNSVVLIKKHMTPFAVMRNSLSETKKPVDWDIDYIYKHCDNYTSDTDYLLNEMTVDELLHNIKTDKHTKGADWVLKVI